MAYERPANNAYGDVETPQYNVPGRTPSVAPKPLVPGRSPIQSAQYGNPYQGVSERYMQQLQAPEYERTDNTRTKDFRYMKDHVDRPDSYQYDRWAREARNANNGRHSFRTGEHEKAAARGWAAEMEVRKMQRQHENDYALQMQGAYKNTSAHNLAEGGYADAQTRQAMQNQGNFAVNDINNTNQRAMDADKNNVLRRGQNVRLQESMMNAALRATAAQNSAATAMYNAERVRLKAGELPDGVTPGKLNLDGSPMTAFDELNARIRGLETFGDSATSLDGRADQSAQQGSPASGALYAASTPQQHGATPSFAPAPQRRAAAPFAPAPHPGAAGAGAPAAPTPGPAAPTPGPAAPTPGPAAPTPALTQAAAGTGGLAGPVTLPTAENYFVGGAPGVSASEAVTGTAEGAAPAAPAIPPAAEAASPNSAVMAGVDATQGGALGGGRVLHPAPGNGLANTAYQRAKDAQRKAGIAKMRSSQADEVMRLIGHTPPAAGVDADGNVIPAEMDEAYIRDHSMAMQALSNVKNAPMGSLQSDQELLNNIAAHVQIARADKSREFGHGGGEIMVDPNGYTLTPQQGFWGDIGGALGKVALRAGEGWAGGGALGAGAGALIGGIPTGGLGAAPGAAAGWLGGSGIGGFAGGLSGLYEAIDEWGDQEITDSNGNTYLIDDEAISPAVRNAMFARQAAADAQSADRQAGLPMNNALLQAAQQYAPR